MEQNRRLFGNVVRDINTFFLPNQIAASINALPNPERSDIMIRDRIFGPNFFMVSSLFLNDGRVIIKGKRWDLFIRDRGIIVGDILLLKLPRNNIPNVIDITVIRPTILFPQQLSTPTYRNQNQVQVPFICVKNLIEADVSTDQLELPREIESGIGVATLRRFNSRPFRVLVVDQSFLNIRIQTRLRRFEAENGRVLLNKNWSRFVNARGIQAGDMIVLFVDLARRVIFITVFRATQNPNLFQDIVIPLLPPPR
uniref:TF-B3 domain-containing protein n=1 Tax=Cannabis sativa TaxID=3483 RepID=A0A803PKU0_CANSA